MEFSMRVRQKREKKMKVDMVRDSTIEGWGGRGTYFCPRPIRNSAVGPLFATVDRCP